MPDDFSRALIVATDVGQNLLELVQVNGISRDQDLRGLRVAQNGPQRLVEFMRKRGGQHARSSSTVQMDDFQQPTAQLEFCAMAAVPLKDQSSLHEQNAEN